jgi:nucleotide-sensitive chloride channel 1A
LWFPEHGSGISISYPSITLHAIQSAQQPSLYLQIESSELVQNDNGHEHGEESLEFMEIVIVPENLSSLQKFYEALSDCASLHPDLDVDDDDDEVNGHGGIMIDDGWITSDNLEEGQADDDVSASSMNGDGPSASLEVAFDDKPGVRAGARRARDELSDNENGSGNGQANSEDPSKWRRTF